IEAAVAEAIDEAVTFSEESEYPDQTELLTDVYVSYQ
ncbi:pyruvate dehydrogenase (acetyl-transferring) E1 component subunit alpha, partial [Bacillus safensis]|nr:pyruvate dehydrogenase (acetyl-transferring) E1 component subunit alpha [Bacillus safensis]